MERFVEDSRGWWNGSSQEAFVRKFVYLNKDARRSLERRLKEYDTLMGEVARVKAEDDEKVGGMLGRASQAVPLRVDMRGVVAGSGVVAKAAVSLTQQKNFENAEKEYREANKAYDDLILKQSGSTTVTSSEAMRIEDARKRRDEAKKALREAEAMLKTPVSKNATYPTENFKYNERHLFGCECGAHLGPHNGIDILPVTPGVDGDPIGAAIDGVVKIESDNENSVNGLFITVTSLDGKISTRYAQGVSCAYQ